MLLLTHRAALQRTWRWKTQHQWASCPLSITSVGGPPCSYPAWEQSVPAWGLDLSRERTRVQHGCDEEEEVRDTFPQFLARRKNDHCVWSSPLLATVVLWQFHPKCIGIIPFFFFWHLQSENWLFSFLHFREKIRKQPTQISIKD